MKRIIQKKKQQINLIKKLIKEEQIKRYYIIKDEQTPPKYDEQRNRFYYNKADYKDNNYYLLQKKYVEYKELKREEIKEKVNQARLTATKKQIAFRELQGVTIKTKQFIAIARKEIEQSLYERAIGTIESSITEINPNELNYYYDTLGMAHLGLGNYEEAFSYFLQAYQIDASIIERTGEDMFLKQKQKREETTKRKLMIDEEFEYEPKSIEFLKQLFLYAIIQMEFRIKLPTTFNQAILFKDGKENPDYLKAIIQYIYEQSNSKTSYAQALSFLLIRLSKTNQQYWIKELSMESLIVYTKELLEKINMMYGRHHDYYLLLMMDLETLTKDLKSSEEQHVQCVDILKTIGSLVKSASATSDQKKQYRLWMARFAMRAAETIENDNAKANAFMHHAKQLIEQEEESGLHCLQWNQLAEQLKMDQIDWELVLTRFSNKPAEQLGYFLQYPDMIGSFEDPLYSIPDN